MGRVVAEVDIVTAIRRLAVAVIGRAAAVAVVGRVVQVVVARGRVVEVVVMEIFAVSDSCAPCALSCIPLNR
jgi:hypothetical protein